MKKVMLFFAVVVLAIGVNAQGEKKDSKGTAKPADKKEAAKPADKKEAAKPAEKKEATKK